VLLFAALTDPNKSEEQGMSREERQMKGFFFFFPPFTLHSFLSIIKANPKNRETVFPRLVHDHNQTEATQRKTRDEGNRILSSPKAKE
jgi:hypothetical protein